MEQQQQQQQQKNPESLTLICNSTSEQKKKESSRPEEVISRMQLRKTTSSKQLVESGTDANAEADRFHNSLQELKGLHSQLYHAADYCQSAFLKATAKKKVVENTKSYICQAVVTVIDHLGCVSSNLELKLKEINAISETEQQIECLKQRILSCEQYAITLNFATIQLHTMAPRHHLHYLSLNQLLRKAKDVSRDAAARMEFIEAEWKKDQLPAAIPATTLGHYLNTRNLNSSNPRIGLVDGASGIQSLETHLKLGMLYSAPSQRVFICS